MSRGKRKGGGFPINVRDSRGAGHVLDLMVTTSVFGGGVLLQWQNGVAINWDFFVFFLVTVDESTIILK